MFCTKCGSELPDGLTHCAVCGAAVRAAFPPHPAQTGPAYQQKEPGGSGMACQPERRPQTGVAYQTPPERQFDSARQSPPQAGPDYPVYHENRGQEPVGMGEWLLTFLLTFLPIVNVIMLFVWAFGNTKPSKRNWARAALIVWGILMLLAVLAVVWLEQAETWLGDPYFRRW